MSIFVSILITFFFIYFLSKLNNFILFLKTYQYAKNLPGPKLHSILGNVPDIFGKTTLNLGEFLKKWAQEGRDRGDKIMRVLLLGNMYIWPLDGQTAASILDSVTELDKGDDYRFFDPWLGGGLIVGDGDDRWKFHRKLLTPTFHFAKLAGYFEVFNAEARTLTEILDQFSSSDSPSIDIYPFISRCNLDIIMGTAMGSKIEAQFNIEHEYVKASEAYLHMAIEQVYKPWLKNSVVWEVTGNRKKCEEHLAVLKELSLQVIRERREAGLEETTSKRMMNFLDLLLSEKSSNALSEEDIRQEVDTFMFAGHDTTSTSVSFALWSIAKYPDIQKRIHNELIDVLGEDLSIEITQEDTAKLTYLDKVLKESKRHTPTVPFVQRKLKNDFLMGGHLIPAGSNINISPMILHSNPEVFPNPLEFDPDRFESSVKRHPYDFIPFSAGLRNCIGQKFALFNEKVIISHILRNFEIFPGEGKTSACLEFVTKPSNGIPIKLRRRQV